MSSEKEIQWITMNGRHIPIGEGESKKEAIQKFLAKQGHTVAKNVVQKRDANKSTNEKAGKSASSSDTVKKAPKLSHEEKKQSEIENAKKIASKVNEEQAYQDSLRMGNKVKIEGKDLVFKGEKLDKPPIKDRVKQEENSLSEHLDADGNFTKERLELHQKIIEDYFGDHKPYAPGQEKKCLFTGGGGASGKGQFSKDVGKFYSSNDNPIVIDSDELKKILCKADTGQELDKDRTPYYHAESSYLTSQILSAATKHGFPVLYDGTATDPAKMEKIFKDAKSKGYKTEINYLFSDYDTVVANSLKRYDETNRLVPYEVQMDAHASVPSAVSALYDKVDNFALYDNRGRAMKLVATSQNGGKLSVKDKSSYDYLMTESKKNFEITPERKAQFESEVAKIDAKKKKAKR